jgi:hypothetical protein
VVSKVGFRIGVAWRGEKGADYATPPPATSHRPRRAGRFHNPRIRKRYGADDGLSPDTRW